MVHSREIPAGVMAGGISGALFVFVFPRGAISTLVHEVFRLPGPGAGIALVLGPWVVFWSLGVVGYTGRNRTALIPPLCFGLTLALLGLFLVSGETKGKFGSPEFLGGMAITGALLAGVGHLVRKRGLPVRATVPGSLAGGGLLAYYWLAIFPQTAGWVVPGQIPLLLGLALAGGGAAGCAALPAGRFIRKSFVSPE